MAKKIKILFAINCMNIGGAPSVVFHQLKHLNTTRFDPYLILLYPSKKANFLDALDFLPEGKIMQFHLKNRSIFDFSTMIRIFRFLRKEKFDVVYTHLFLANFLIRGLGRLASIPVILSFEHSEYREKKRWQMHVDKFLARFTDRILVSVPSVADFTSHQENIPREKFFTLSNPVVLPSRKDIDVSSLKKKAGIPSESQVVLTIGRFSEEKGHIVLLQAALAAHRQNSKLFFLIVGHGHLENELTEYVKANGMGEYCAVRTDPLHAKEFLFVADIFVLPSLREGQAIVLYEAMMAGVPVIASSLAGVRDIVEQGKNGILFEPENSEVLAREILGLACDRARLREFAEAGAKSVKDISPEKNAFQFECLVLQLCASKNILTK